MSRSRSIRKEKRKSPPKKESVERELRASSTFASKMESPMKKRDQKWTPKKGSAERDAQLPPRVNQQDSPMTNTSPMMKRQRSEMSRKSNGTEMGSCISGDSELWEKIGTTPVKGPDPLI
jgi:hypothetical protein